MWVQSKLLFVFRLGFGSRSRFRWSGRDHAVHPFKNGALGLLEGNTAAFPGFCARLDIYGTDGGIIIENDEIRDRRFRAEGEGNGDFYGSISHTTKGSTGAGASSAAIGASSHERQIRDVVSAILEGRQPKVTGEEARSPLAIILAVYESARTGGPVKVR